MSKLQHEIGLRYRTITNKKTILYRELTKTKRCINHYVLETEFIINACPVFYCMDTVTICNSSEIQSLAKNQGHQHKFLEKKSSFKVNEQTTT